MVTSALTGLEAAGYLGGIVGTFVAIIALYVTIAANNRQKRKEYEQEIEAAYRKGKESIMPELKQAQRDAEFYRSEVFKRGIALQLPLRPPNNPAGEDD